MKKILIIHTGGTFGMVPLKPSQALAPDLVQKNILSLVPELRQIADIDFEVAFNLDSANIQPRHWLQLAQMVAAHVDEYDGFVVIHGTDSMAYSATALSFMLRNLPRPVIFTGSQRPLAEIRSDARSNLINAVELATYPIPEVSIFFGTELLRGNRAVKISSTDYGAFISPNFPPLATVGLEIRLSDQQLKPHGKFALQTTFSDAVIAVRFFPGLCAEYLEYLVNTSLRAVVIEGLGMGNVAVMEGSLLPLIQRLTAAGKLVVINSQSTYGWVDLDRYENGKRLAEAGAVGSGDMTTEATIVKLMHLAGNGAASREELAQRLPVPIAGEITPRE